MEQIAANIHTAAAMLGVSRITFWRMRPELKAHGMKQCGKLIDLESLRQAWGRLCAEAAGDVRRKRKGQDNGQQDSRSRTTRTPGRQASQPGHPPAAPVDGAVAANAAVV